MGIYVFRVPDGGRLILAAWLWQPADRPFFGAAQTRKADQNSARSASACWPHIAKEHNGAGRRMACWEWYLLAINNASIFSTKCSTVMCAAARILSKTGGRKALCRHSFPRKSLYYSYRTAACRAVPAVWRPCWSGMATADACCTCCAPTIYSVAASSTVSKASMISPILTSLKFSRPTPHSLPLTTSLESSLKRLREEILPV